MSESGPPPGGGGGLILSQDSSTPRKSESELKQTGTEVQTLDSDANSVTTMTGAWASGGKQKCRGRSYGDIVNEAQKNQKNVLYINLEKEDDSKKVQFLGQKDILEIFSKLNINVDDIERCDIHSRYDIKEIHFKSNIDDLGMSVY